MYIIQTTYSLRLYQYGKDDVEELKEALDLYSRHTPSYERTSSSEIVYWFERYNKEFEDRFYLLGFYQNQTLIGFAEIGYFHKEKFATIDYMTIESAAYGNNTFFEFIEQIKQFFSTERIEIDFIVAEIPFDLDWKPLDASWPWIRLLGVNGFGLLDAKYRQPQLGQANPESSTPAGLMIYSNFKVKTIQITTYKMVTDAILENYYLRWYKPFLEESDYEHYSLHIQDIKSEIEKALHGRTTVGILPIFNESLSYTSFNDKITVLFLGANPDDRTRLALSREFQEIDDRLRSSKYRDQFELIHQWETKATNVPSRIMRFNPVIVHFSGHGTIDGELIFQDDQGRSAKADKNTIAMIFRLLSGRIKCVLLNACFSKDQGKAIARYINAVIGMDARIGDRDAADFSASFYEALAYGKDIESAFSLAKNSLGLQGSACKHAPVLISQEGIDLHNLYITKKDN